jgi:5'-methylthioadenosine phosphorylase
MIYTEIPKTEFAIIGGSGTWAGDFPESAGFQGLAVLQKDMEYETPFGITMPMKLVELSAEVTSDKQPRRFLTVPFHGYHGLAPHNTPAEQIFWVFQRAGVKVIVSEGSGGGINPLLDPGDVIIPHDFIDFTKRPSNIHRFTNNIIRMRNPSCPYLRALYFEKAQTEYRRVFARGVYGNTEPPRFETASEIRMLFDAHCDIAGHTMSPEIYLARAIGACYASAYLISNHAEGVIDVAWKGSIFDYYRESADKIGRVTLGIIAAWDRSAAASCGCAGNLIAVPAAVKERIGV